MKYTQINISRVNGGFIVEGFNTKMREYDQYIYSNIDEAFDNAKRLLASVKTTKTKTKKTTTKKGSK